MVLEHVDILIHPEQQAAFEVALKLGLESVLLKSRGFLGYRINRGLETPERYVLLFYWETLENHTVDFRESPAFAAWRAIVGPHFARPPLVEHFTLLDQAL